MSWLRKAVGGLIVAAAFTPLGLWAASDNAGTESPFMAGVGARAMALGKTFVAVADDATTLFWNPAGLAQLQQKEIQASHAFLNDGLSYDFLAYAHPWYELGTLAIGGMNLSTGDIEKRDDHNELLGTFNSQQMQGLVSFARYLYPGFAVGMSLTLQREVLDDKTATGMGFDLGGLYNISDNFAMGFVLKNLLPPELRLQDTAETLPINIRLGAAYRRSLDAAGNHRIMASVELEKPNFNAVYLHGGLEYWFYQVMALRAGWDGERPRAGLGLAVAGLELDYAFNWQEEVGLSNFVSLSWRFGLSAEEVDRLRRRRITEETYNELSQKMYSQYKTVGMTQYNSEQYASAIASLQRAVGWKTDPTLEEYIVKSRKQGDRLIAVQYFQQGLAALKQRQSLEAILAFREAIGLNPDYPECREKLRQVKDQVMEEARTVPLTKAQKRLRPEFLKGLDHFLNNEYIQAIEVWNRVRQKAPDYPRLQASLVKAQQVGLRQITVGAGKSGETNPALKAHLEQAATYYKALQFTQAQSEWQEAQKLDPTNLTAKLGLERVGSLLEALRQRGLE